MALASFLIAGLLGFASHRAGLCTVGAMAEVIHTRRAHLLGSFVKASIWALTLALTITWLWPEHSMPAHGYAFSAASLLGGFAFGVGAALNGGCTFSTLRYLAEGRLSFMGTLLGFWIGAVAARMAPAPEPASTLTIQPDALPIALVSAMWLWVFWVVIRLWRSHPKGTPLITAERYRLTTSALILGFGGAALLTLQGSWTYTSAVRGAVGVRPVQAAQLGLFVSLLAGMLLSSWLRHSIRLRRDRLIVWLMRAAGGFLMGMGSTLIPGGSTTLVLTGIPSLSPHAIPAYAAILIGVGLTLVLTRSAVRVRCVGDVCPL